MSSVNAPCKENSLSSSGAAIALPSAPTPTAGAISGQKATSSTEALARVNAVYASCKEQSDASRRFLGRDFIIVASEAERAAFTDLMLDATLLLSRSKADDKAATMLFGMISAVAQKQDPKSAPILAKITQVARKAIAYLPAPNPKAAEELHQILLKLFCAKEFLILTNRQAEMNVGIDKLDQERMPFGRLEHNANPTNSKGLFRFDLIESGVLAACEKSIEAMILFSTHFCFLRVNIRLQPSKAFIELDATMTPFSFQKTQNLREHLKSSANIHVQTVAKAFLALIDADQGFIKHEKILAIWSEFTNASKIFDLGKNPAMAVLMPQFKGTVDHYLSYCQSEVEKASKATVKDDSIDPEFSKLLIEDYKQFAASSQENDFVYRLFYERLMQEKALTRKNGLREFTRKYLKGHTFSVCHRSPALPTPEEYATLAFNDAALGLAVDEAPAPVAEYDSKDSKDSKVREVKGKKAKKDPFARFAEESATVAAVFVPKPDELSKTSKSGSAGAPVVAASSTSSPNPLETVFMGRTVDPSAFKYAPRVDAAVQAAADWNHGFTTALDKFLGTPGYSMQSKWKNTTTGQTDTLHCFIVEAENAQGKKTRHVATYAVDSQGVIYHRCLQSKSHDELIDQIMKDQIRDKLDYPSLAESAKAQQGKQALVVGKVDDVAMHLDQAFGFITVKDEKHKMIFRVIPKPTGKKG
jgi:hypothetical protein